MWEYRATVARWIDGDTLDATLDLGFRISTAQRLRLMATAGGVDTYEMNDRDPARRALAVEGLRRVNDLAPPGTAFVARTAKGDPRDSFGRFLSRVILADGRDLGDLLLAEGLAVVWKG